jgi:hypothetical protein
MAAKISVGQKMAGLGPLAGMPVAVLPFSIFSGALLAAGFLFNMEKSILLQQVNGLSCSTHPSEST